MRTRISEAIILRHYDYGEADRVVIAFTRDYGRIRGIAKHARKSRRRFGPALDSFARIDLHWNPPKPGALSFFQQAELINLHHGLRDSLLRITLAGYGVELVEGLTEEGEVAPQVFDILAAFLTHLATGGPEREAKMLLELRLLDCCGYIPHLLHCSSCMRIFDDEEIAFDAASGGSLCLGCAPPAHPLRLSSLTVGSFSRSLKTNPTLFSGFRFGRQTMHEGSIALANALRLHLHRPISSAKFLDDLLASGD